MLRNKMWFLLAIPFLLAILGIDYGLPMHFIGDEEALIGGAMKMGELKTLIPALYPEQFSFLYYPPVIPYIILVFSLPLLLYQLLVSGGSERAVLDYFAMNQSSIWFMARLFVGFASVGTVAVLYGIARKIFTTQVAFFSTLVLVTSFFHVVLSHWVRHWMVSTFVMYATFLSVLWFIEQKNRVVITSRILDTRNLKLETKKLSNIRYLISNFLPGLLGGIGFGISYIASLGFVAGVVYLFFHRKEIRNFWKVLTLNGVIFLVVGGGLAALNIQEMYRIFGYDGSWGSPKSFSLLVEFFWSFILVLLRQEVVIVLLAVGALMFVRQHWKKWVFILGVSTLFIFVLYRLFHFELRYVYPLIPALSIMAGSMLSSIYEKFQKKPVAVIIILLAAWPVVSVFQYERLLLVQDTRELAVEWIQEHVKQDVPFLISSETIELPRTIDALEEELKYGRIRAKERYKISQQPTARFDSVGSRQANSQQEFTYYNLHFWRDDITQNEIDAFMHREKPKYFIVDYWNMGALSNRERELMKKGRLITQFKQSDRSENIDVNGNFFRFNVILFRLERLGPTVDVYDMSS